MARNRAEKRRNERKAIRRKANVIRNVLGDTDWFDTKWGQQLHRLSKRSLSIPKTKSVNDQRKQEAMNYDEEDSLD